MVLRNIFSSNAENSIPPTHLIERDVLFILGCSAREGDTETKEVGDKESSRYATYTFKNKLDGKTLELEIYSRFGDKEYKTHILSEQVHEGVLDIKSIVFDNEEETLRNPKEIYSVLNWIGNQTRWIFFGNMPAIHENKGEFGKIGRFMTRHLPKPKPDSWL